MDLNIFLQNLMTTNDNVITNLPVENFGNWSTFHLDKPPHRFHELFYGMRFTEWSYGNLSKLLERSSCVVVVASHEQIRELEMEMRAPEGALKERCQELCQWIKL